MADWIFFLFFIFLCRSYPLYVNIWKKDVMDSRRETKVGIEPRPVDDKELQLEGGQAAELDGKSAEAGVEAKASEAGEAKGAGGAPEVQVVQK